MATSILGVSREALPGLRTSAFVVFSFLWANLKTVVAAAAASSLRVARREKGYERKGKIKLAFFRFQQLVFARRSDLQPCHVFLKFLRDSPT